MAEGRECYTNPLRGGCARAAHQLQDAIRVPPAYRPAIAQPYEAALSMPLDERRERHARLQDNVKTQDLAKWREDYLAALRFAPRGPYWRHGRSGGAGRERRSGDNRVLFPLRRIP